MNTRLFRSAGYALAVVMGVGLAAGCGRASGTSAEEQVPMAVACEPYQHAVIERTHTGVMTARCVTQSDLMAGASFVAPGVATARAVPATYTAAPAVQREVVYRDVERPAARSSGRSWGRSALVIGGLAGTGAGVGGAVGGKKGALIGAAIGGGSGSLYEAAKRR